MANKNKRILIFSLVASISLLLLLGKDFLPGNARKLTPEESLRTLQGVIKIIRDDYSGKIEQVNHVLLTHLLEEGYTPVIAPLAISSEGETLNVDADRAAAMVAAGLGAETLILLTSAPGLMSNFPDESTLIHKLLVSRIDEAREYAQGRMKKKILGAEEALSSGVETVIIADGRVQHPVKHALEGNGTTIQ